MSESCRNVCLIVIDGWGIAQNEPSSISISQVDAIKAAKTPVMDSLRQNHQYTTLAAHGLAVGLPDGLMGNSEVGHLNIGAGRVVYQDIVRIDLSIQNGSMAHAPVLLNALKNASCLHLVGLLSDGGVHSHINHLFALLEYARKAKIPQVYIHAITDGRDTAPTSAPKYISMLQKELAFCQSAKLATVIGRYYAMDRDQRWDRTKIAYDALVSGIGLAVAPDDLIAEIENRYAQNVPERDEFLRPMILEPEGVLKSGDSIILFNYRSDRMRQLASCIGAEKVEDLPFLPKKFLGPTRITCMTQYNAEFPFPVISPPQKLDNVMAEWLSRNHIRQFHTAETEKYAHVTFFFNGGREEPFAGEDRHLVSSPKVATYDLKPEMSVDAVAQTLIKAMASGKYPFVMANFAPPDMVGHTGHFEPTVRAVEATDKAIGQVYDACKRLGYVLLVTADHGNAEVMKSADGKDHTAHTCSPVPFISTSSTAFRSLPDRAAALCDVAPTVLALLGLELPSEMSGSSLVELVPSATC